MQTAALAEITEQEELAQLLAAARELRGNSFGELVTFSPKIFIPLTKLCRDVCHYCTFARPPKPSERVFMDLDEVLEIARKGAAAGCSEALFTLGDKPELRYKAARDELAELGFASTLAYLKHCAKAVMDETGLLPHLNPGVMTAGDLAELRPVSASMGIMLETVSSRLSERGGPHFGSPDKLPDARLETIELAGKAQIPFTTGILIGIGETRAERIEALLAIKDLHDRYGHIQEVIVQNFRAKPDTLMADHPEPSFEELLWTTAVARLLLGEEISVQVPPNLSDSRFGELLEAGINDWGGVSPLTPDHVNPEAPWPELQRLESVTEKAGMRLAARLPIYPRYLEQRDRWLDPAVQRHALALSDSEGLARRELWHAGEVGELPSEFEPLKTKTPSPGPLTERQTPAVHSALTTVSDAGELSEQEIVALLKARGTDLAAVVAAADLLRRETVGDEVTYVVNRNVNYTNVCYFRCSFCAFSKGKLADDLRGKPYLVPLEEIGRRAEEAWSRGATEICLQGGIHPAFDGDYYLSVVREVKRTAPQLHIHAFSPLEIWQGAATLGIGLTDYLEQLKEAGLDTLPGTSAEILDDEIRQLICPEKNTTDQWFEVMLAAHEVGLPSTSTIMFGHVERPEHVARHLIRLREAQKLSLGFTEFVPLPFVHMEAPMAKRGWARYGPTFREVLLVHAVGRLALHPWITNIQASWVKLGEQGVSALLNAGVNDVGGTLMNESISRAAGASYGEELPPDRIEQLANSIGRTARQRNTLYGEVSPERTAAADGAAPLSEPYQQPVREAGLKRRRELIRPGNC